MRRSVIIVEYELDGGRGGGRGEGKRAMHSVCSDGGFEEAFHLRSPARRRRGVPAVSVMAMARRLGAIALLARLRGGRTRWSAHSCSCFPARIDDCGNEWLRGVASALKARSRSACSCRCARSALSRLSARSGCSVRKVRSCRSCRSTRSDLSGRSARSRSARLARSRSWARRSFSALSALSAKAAFCLAFSSCCRRASFMDSAHRPVRPLPR
ncbi:uncharacterized protein BO72DRAFT_148455 [Aspergillus fijiensis CBS 313.89]|uniref:Uncharacterized protein n=1 Tax=Aspergillus fijiensis CBS 313.89 TaxID=1448319 RepID=A0A8G1RSW4_9EURO|nr:uncharacterized protein BO72DRAFT_148455 [Aspergillus fijiensis CBS 313.89]RAK76131.1 hypothetical protein BO72DRAFT_148455 [Aspergillus fijiensis CBS 313.89]